MNPIYALAVIDKIAVDLVSIFRHFFSFGKMSNSVFFPILFSPSPNHLSNLYDVTFLAMISNTQKNRWCLLSHQFLLHQNVPIYESLFTPSHSEFFVSFIFDDFGNEKRKRKKCVRHLAIKFKPGRFNSSIIWCIYNYYLKFVRFMIWKNLLINKIHTKYQKHFRLWPTITMWVFNLQNGKRKKEDKVTSLGFAGVWFSTRFFYSIFDVQRRTGSNQWLISK